MPFANAFQIAVLPGDGIGPEVMQPCLQVLVPRRTRSAAFRFRAPRIRPVPSTTATRRGLAEGDAGRVPQADAILLRRMGWPDRALSRRHGDRAADRPALRARALCRRAAGATIPGMPQVLADPRAAKLDFVVMRESTEGLFASRGKGMVDGRSRGARHAGHHPRGSASACSTSRFALARQRKARGRPGGVTCVDKANVFRRLRLLPQGLRRARGEVPRHRGRPRLRRCHRALHGAPALGPSTCWSPRTCSATSSPISAPA